MWASYVAIAGSTNHRTTDRTSPSGAAHHSAGGTFPGARTVRIADFKDGTSNTMIVAEQSAFLRDNTQNRTGMLERLKEIIRHVDAALTPTRAEARTNRVPLL